jgi:hypothetical protein
MPRIEADNSSHCFVVFRCAAHSCPILQGSPRKPKIAHCIMSRAQYLAAQRAAAPNSTVEASAWADRWIHGTTSTDSSPLAAALNNGQHYTPFLPGPNSASPLRPQAVAYQGSARLLPCHGQGPQPQPQPQLQLQQPLQQPEHLSHATALVTALRVAFGKGSQPVMALSSGVQGAGMEGAQADLLQAQLLALLAAASGSGAVAAGVPGSVAATGQVPPAVGAVSPQTQSLPGIIAEAAHTQGVLSAWAPPHPAHPADANAASLVGIKCTGGSMQAAGLNLV